AAIHSQLDRVFSGLCQLHNALGDVKDIQNSLAEFSNDLRQSINTIESLKDVKYAGDATESACFILFEVADTPLMIEQAELLEDHHKLMNLECSSNDLMYDHYHMGSKNTHNMNLIRNYFVKVQGLSEDQAKQLWIVLQHAMGKAEGHSEQFSQLYHITVFMRVQELAAEGLMTNKVVSLLTWVLN
ncbi:unnamed protein product, partial [Coregonus sp. 'balchen']